ncbi:MAG: type II toxin-antitoxin system RelE/ParE family toxin [Verrucomicrobia bacterium]|nr:type II toxin-antitoxin system RelE/ParE family toxin [Verrucomicrobiota bacterium]
MIKSFSSKSTEAIFNGVYSHGVRKEFSPNLVKTAERRLDLLNCAENLESLKLIPSLKGEGGVRDAHGKYSIPLDREWRLVFGWNNGPENVEIKGY